MDQVSARQVVLLSDAAIERTKEWLGPEAWDDLAKYHRHGGATWKETQRQRDKKLTPEQKEKRKCEALASCIKAQDAYPTF